MIEPEGDFVGELLDGRYQVIEAIGHGAMGDVYRGERRGLGRAVAIKVMRDRVADELASRQRFEREALAMAKLEHPHCASVLDVGMHHGRPYLVMDFVSGQSLEDVVAAGPLPIARAIDITRQILSGLAHAHELGIVHRDLKPANVVLSHKAGLGDHATLLDFGIARLSDQSSNLTAGYAVGTPSYMAPEQASGQVADSRADLYACGVLLFELLTGDKPFRSPDDSPVEVCMMHVTMAPPRLAAVRPGVAFGPLEDVVARALKKDREDRYPTAEAFSQALAEAGAAMAEPGAVAGDVAPATRELRAPAVATAVMTPAPVEALAAPRLAAPTGSGVVIEPPVAAAPDVAAAWRTWPRWWFAAAGGGALAVVVVITLVARGGGHAAAPVAVAPRVDAGVATVAAAPVESDDPIPAVIDRAEDLAREGQLKPAIEALLKARRGAPGDARLPLTAGKLYLAKLWFGDAVPQLRAAFSIDQSLRGDPEVIKLLIAAFNAPRSYDAAIARFLRDDIGQAARPFLEEVAAHHPNAIVKKRAADELRRY